MHHNEIYSLILDNELLQKERPAAEVRDPDGAPFELALSRDDQLSTRVLLRFFVGAPEPVNVLVYNGEGEICIQKDKRCKRGYNLFRLNLERLPEGVYKIVLVSATGSQELRVTR